MIDNNNKNIMIMLTLLVISNLIMSIAYVIFIYNLTDNEHYIRNGKYQRAAIDNMNNDIIISISDICSHHNITQDKIKCVVKIVNDGNLFKYKNTFNVIPADDLIDNGGDCKSWTSFYIAIFNNLNINTSINNMENHVFLTAYGTDFYCIIDQLSVDCRGLKV